jgi:hypothetical protein
VSFGNNTGTAINQVHIVATGDVTMTSNLTYYGAIYTKDTLTHSGDQHSK